MAFLGVFYYDKPVHDDLAVYMNGVCISGAMKKIAAAVGNKRREVWKSCGGRCRLL